LILLPGRAPGHSARGPAHSRTLARITATLASAERPEMRWSSAAVLARELVRPYDGVQRICIAKPRRYAIFLPAFINEAATVNTEYSNPAGQFLTTRWSLVLLAGQAGEAGTPDSLQALENLCRAYWQPVCLFARRKGWSEEDAKDLTQQFFVHLLTHNVFHGLDARKGKFRTFLLTAFTHFLANEHDRINALKRGGGRQIVSFDEFSADGFCDFPSMETLAPGEVFDVRWAKNILEAAFQRLKREMLAGNKSVEFETLKPFLTVSAAASDYAAAAEKLGLEAASVAVRVHRLRHHYRELVREEVAQTVTTPMELDEEMRHLFELLNQ
jgi:RNA polymerase sigma-70 factor (ECF subfamily)